QLIIRQHASLFFSLLLSPPRATLFPYTTLFRSHGRARPRALCPDYLDRSKGVQSVSYRQGQGKTNCAQRRSTYRLRRWAQLVFPDRKSTRLNSSHRTISYAVFCLNKTKKSRETP